MNEKKPHLTFGDIFSRCLVSRVGFRTNEIEGFAARNRVRDLTGMEAFGFVVSSTC
jgi:hypothetical protein